MPRKNVLERYQLVTDASMGANVISPVTSIKYLDNIMIEFVATGSPVGAYSIEVSGDYNADSFGNVIFAGNWTPLPLNPTATVSGAGVIVLDLNQLPVPYLRSVYTRTSGTGTLNIFVSAKEI